MTSEPTPTLHRRAFFSTAAAVVGGTVLAACGSDDSATGASTTTTTTGGSSTSSSTTAAASASSTAATGGGAETPSETGGPFPADGSNDNGEGTVANVLADSRSVRSDIRSDLDGSNTQPGAAMNLAVSVVDRSGAPLAGRAVYVWHCNKEGEYSEYNTRMGGGDFSDRSFLRGVQVTDANGTVNFTSILPGRYQGRAFHIHFEVFGDETYAKKALTSQMAIDDDLITSIYTDAGYATGLRNVTTNADDNVFGDGVEHQLLDVTGTASSGLTARFTAVLS
ncbi:MAG TPA: hypothetical protein PKD80_18945 [Microthrixaceae bacterium]|nr:hypothetical protein [Microthrixaceae bacterium]